MRLKDIKMEPEMEIFPTDISSLLMRNYELSKLNQTVGMELTAPIIRSSLRYVYPLFIFLHACTSVVGVAGNCALIVVIIKQRLYKNPTFFFLANLALSDLLKAAIVSPITLANLLMHNFIFGRFMCFFLPMMHSFPIHASMLTYIMLAIDRYRFIVYPMKARVPSGLCAIGVWVISVCVVLPYAIYIKYIDLQPLIGTDLRLCIVDHESNIEEYVRAMFVIFYCLPLAIFTFLCVKVSAELKANEESSTVTLRIEERHHSVSEATYQSHITWSTHDDSDLRLEADGASVSSSCQPSQSVTGGRHQQYQDNVYDGDMDTHKEKRTQKYMIAMVTLFASCWCPITILILVTHFVYEDEDNMGNYDITYLTFTFIGYLSTCVNPVLFVSWQMSDRAKNRLKGYFRFSNRSRRRSSCGSVLCGMSQISNNHQNTPTTATINNSNSNVGTQLITADP